MGGFPYFPMFVDLSQKRVLVVGAGAIASRRIEVLLHFCQQILVVAPDIRFRDHSEAAAERVCLCQRPFQPSDLDGADMVIAATNDPQLNADIAARCRARGIPVNVASDSALCDFYFPGVAMDDDIVIGVTASGRNHRRAREAAEHLREALEKGSI